MSYKTYDAIEELAASKKVSARCPFDKCNAKVIPVDDKLRGSLVEVKNAPEMVIPGSESTSPKTLNQFYKVDDVWDFDNIGVSRTSPDISGSVTLGDSETPLHVQRLLICSECDRGPIGFAALEDLANSDHRNLKYFLNCTSILYETE